MMVRRVSMLVVLAVICAADAFAGNAQWVQVKSPNFTVITDAGEKRGRDTALHFEQMRAIFGTLFVKAKINSSQPLYILAFKNTKEFRAVCPLWKGKPEELAGYFQQGNGVTYIALDLSTENKWTVVFHEYGHFLLNSNSKELPPWFDEGFAEYFSTVRVEGKNFIFGNIPEGDPQILQQYTWLTVDQLFSVKHDSAAYNERNRQTIFYAESWMAMAHYWFNSTERKRVLELLSLQSAEVPIDHAIQQAFGMDTKAMNKDLQTFYSSGKVMVARAAMPPGLDNVAMTAAPMEEIDARARVAELKLQLRDHQQEAVQEFEEIVKEKPDHPVALRGLAYASLQSGDKEKAADYFRKAAALATDDPHIYFFSAVLLSQMDAKSHPEMLAEMQKDLERAVQLDPNYADAYGWLGLAYSWQGKHDEAIAPAEKAVELSPRDDQWALNLAGDYGNVKRIDDALKVCQRAMKSTNPAIAQQAATMYESMNRYQAQMAEYEKWQKDRDRDAAAAQVIEERVDVEPSTTGPDHPPVLQRRVQVSGHVSEQAVLNHFEGTLRQVSCAGKQATFTVRSTPSLLTLVAPDVERVSFSGKTTFSCSLSGMKVQGYYSKKANLNQIVALEFEDAEPGK